MPANLRLAPPVTERPEAAIPQPIRVVLADDHEAMRRSLRRLLDAEDGIKVLSEASDLQMVTRDVEGHSPHVLILDLRLPNGSALGTIREVRRRTPGTQVVVLTMETSPAFAKQALDAGALGYVLKEQADRDLPAAVRAAAKGESYVTTEIAAELEAMRSAAGAERLTDREIEVLRLTALGYTAGQAAKELHVSVRTVETHRASLHRKLGLQTRAGLVRYALRRHLIGS